MNNFWIKYSWLFILLVLIQILVLNHFSISKYIYPMAYLLLLIILPVTINKYVTLFIAIALGVLVDAFSDTFGLHTSSLVLIVYVRPIILNLIRPKNGYDNINEITIHQMGKFWFSEYSIILLFIHYLWFFSLEIFRIDMIGTIILKTTLSTLTSFIIIIIFQYLFFKPLKQ